MRDIVIYGAGGFGRETAWMIEQINNTATITWKVKGFYDDGLKKGSIVDGLPILGGIDDINKIKQETNLVVAIADPDIRKRIVPSIQNEKILFPTLIHPSANIGSPTNHVGKGSIVTAGCIFTVNVFIADFAIINLAATIGHDVVIENYSTVMPGCNLSGNVKIGEGTLVGTGAQILQNITVGKNCKIGAGAVVTKSFDGDVTIIGVPAKIRNQF